jgi:Flp pilus assembly protein TadD
LPKRSPSGTYENVPELSSHLTATLGRNEVTATHEGEPLTAIDRATQEHLVELIQSGRAESAIELLNHHLRQEPQDWYALYMSGVALRALGRLGEAAARLTKAVSIKADEASVHLALGKT